MAEVEASARQRGQEDYENDEVDPARHGHGGKNKPAILDAKGPP